MEESKDVFLTCRMVIGSAFQVDMSSVSFIDNDVDILCSSTSSSPSAIRISSFQSESQPKLNVARCVACTVALPYTILSETCNDTIRPPSTTSGESNRTRLLLFLLLFSLLTIAAAGFYSCGFGISPPATRGPTAVPQPAWITN